MPPIRSLVSKCRNKLVLLILLLGKNMPSYSCCSEKRLLYIIITASSGRQPSFYSECTKVNIYLSCNVRSIFNTKYTFLIRLINF